MSFVSLEGFFFKTLSVIFDVGFQLSHLIFESISLGDEDIIDHIMGIEDFY